MKRYVDVVSRYDLDDPQDKRELLERMGESIPTSNSTQSNLKELVCSDCGKNVTKKVAEYSKNNFGSILCFNCQSKHKEGN